MIGIPSYHDARIGAALIGAVQFAFTAAFWRILRRPKGPGGYAPPAAVLVACKGDRQGLEENVSSLLRQDYPGSIEYVFVAPSEADPAYGRIQRALAAFPGGRWRLLCSQARPTSCSEQNVNLLYALGRLAPETEVLLFADCDLRVEPTWAADLVGPLREESLGATTATVLYVPRRGGLPGLLRLLWIASGLPYFAALGCVSGQSFALRRALFESLGLAEIWSRTINMDLTVADRLHRAGKPVRFVPSAMPAWLEDCDAADVLRGFNKWMLHFRLYGPLVWVLACLVTAAKLLICWRALVPRHHPGLASAMAALDVANAYWILRLVASRLPRLVEPLWPPYRRCLALAAAAAPLLIPLYAVNLLSSAWPGTLRWGGYRYRIRGPLDIQVVP